MIWTSQNSNPLHESLKRSSRSTHQHTKEKSNGIWSLPRQRTLQELPIQAHTIYKLIENRSQFACLLPKRCWKTCWKQRKWSMNQTNTWDCSRSLQGVDTMLAANSTKMLVYNYSYFSIQIALEQSQVMHERRYRYVLWHLSVNRIRACLSVGLVT